MDDLGPGPTAEHLLRGADGWPGLVCLRGRFADGHPVLTSHPLRTIDHLPDLLVRPTVAGSGDAVGGGWFGVLGYDAGTTRFAWHDHLVRLVDGRWRFEALWTPGRAAALDERRTSWAELIASGVQPARRWHLGPASRIDETAHLAAVEHAITAIRAGEIYQANVCGRISATFTGSLVALFAASAERLDPEFGAYLDGRIASLSPELFLRLRDGVVRSAPIKGTVPDEPGRAAALRASDKDAAENVMIVDLVRNDLGRVCTTGSVRVPHLLRVVRRVGVLHLESEVIGTPRPDVGVAELVAAAFPPGSVTGAPKRRAIELIAELERPQARGAFTGAVGFVSPVWGVELAVAIRTWELVADRLELGVGGGITADSVPALELAECGHKTAPLLVAAGAEPAPTRTPGPPPGVDPQQGLLETVLVLDGHTVRLTDHLARLSRSFGELWGRDLPPDLVGRVVTTAGSAPPGRHALRIVAGPDIVDVHLAPAPPRVRRSDAVVVPRPAGCWRHKWADRRWAQQAEAAAGSSVPLFVDQDGAVLETSRGTVFVVTDDGALMTAPLRDDVLPGVTRRAVLDRAHDLGVPVRLAAPPLDLVRGCAAFWTSSLSGVVPIGSLDGHPLPPVPPAMASALVVS